MKGRGDVYHVTATAKKNAKKYIYIDIHTYLLISLGRSNGYVLWRCKRYYKVKEGYRETKFGRKQIKVITHSE